VTCDAPFFPPAPAGATNLIFSEEHLTKTFHLFLYGILLANNTCGRRRVMKPVTTGAEREIRDEKRPTIESNIVDTMRRYFENDTGMSKGDLEYTIINSVKRYFEGKPPEL
jgi:hypothetical protein